MEVELWRLAGGALILVLVGADRVDATERAEAPPVGIEMEWFHRSSLQYLAMQ